MFETYKLNEKGFEEVRMFKSEMAQAVEVVLNLMPDSRDKSEFKTCIETAMFFGTRALASKEGNYSEVIKHTAF